jgi:pyruvate formate lyase activating enzyme
MARLDPTRRRFLRQALRTAALTAGAGVLVPDLLGFARWLESGHSTSTAQAAGGASLARLLRQAPAARYWIGAGPGPHAAACLDCHTAEELHGETSHQHHGQPVRCLLCAHRCLSKPGERGACRDRYNDDGTLKTLVWGRPITTHTDPIEKKPFYHFLPGSMAFSLATSGCPLRCKFCQNWEISQASPEDYAPDIIPPQQIVSAGQQERAPIVAFTYNEPTVFFEYMADIAAVAREEGLRCVLVSCGFMQPEPLQDMCGFLDAIKIDLKGINEHFYHEVCQAELAPVQRSIRTVARSGVHLEIVNLVVPTLNDAESDLDTLSAWIASETGFDTPVHFTRFHPDYQLRNLPPTPVQTLEHARELALGHGLHYPYVGNVPGHPGDNTYCPHCGKVVIARKGFFIEAINLKDGRCAACGQTIAGVWK